LLPRGKKGAGFDDVNRDIATREVKKQAELFSLENWAGCHTFVPAYMGMWAWKIQGEMICIIST
jgi:hypothetical protein